MKKIKLLSLIVLSLFMSGCAKMNASVKIKMDKSMDYEIIEAFDQSVIDSLNELGGTSSTDESNLMDDEELDKYKKLGYTIEEYNENNMKGYRIKKHFNSIDLVSTESNTDTDLLMSDSQYMFKVKKGFFKNTYTASLGDGGISDYSDMVQDNQSTEEQQYEEEINGLDLKFTVELPYKAISNNATTVSNGGKKLEWDLTQNPDNIDFTFSLYNIENIAVVFGVIFVGLVGIVIGYVKTKDNDDDDDDKNQEQNKKIVNNSNIQNENVAMHNNINQINQEPQNTVLPNNNIFNQNIQQTETNPFITNNNFIQNNDMMNQNIQQPENNPFFQNNQ